jgi:hypothetical protein
VAQQLRILQLLWAMERRLGMLQLYGYGEHFIDGKTNKIAPAPKPGPRTRGRGVAAE